ncbi:UDP-glucuronosyltransferase 2B15-like isoform X2 [Spodoptera litura]|nr:UDP-glucuronosyltransferase 2B15-like isoform X2 [Spodoptera litura]XP_022815543.1 UDP-glucuronosyltransferase 2B15-like isoform X2 [Spodoptera litura]
MDRVKVFCLLVRIVLTCGEASKILVVFPMPSRSHGNLGDGVVRHLLNAGHEVTYITPFVYKNPPPKLRTVDVSATLDVIPKDMMTIKSIMDRTIVVENIGFLIYMMTQVLKTAVETESVQKLLNDPKEEFDLVIAEWMFSDVPAGVAAIYDCPLIWLSSVEAHWMILQLIDQPTNPAYTVDIMSTYTPPLNFWQRANEIWTQVKIKFLNFVWLDGLQERAYKELFAPFITKRGKQPPSFDDVRHNASMILSNAYVSTSVAQSLPQSHKYIGGYHIEEKGTALPEDIKKIMDNAKNGVVYFSMGSNLQSKDMPDEIKRDLLKMLGTLKQIVLWKFEEQLENVPSNVHILNWAPQQAILSHPNLAVFVTHGGLLSTTEAVHFGVPIIGIPVFADQFMNVAKSVNRGFALRVDLSYSLAAELKKAIHEVTSNSRYAEKAKELSYIHHDRPVKPGVELVHWVNHVITTRGAPHLRSPALHVPFYQKMYLDLAAVLVILFLAGRVVLKKVCAAVCSKKKSSTEGKKKNN